MSKYYLIKNQELAEVEVTRFSKSGKSAWVLDELTGESEMMHINNIIHPDYYEEKLAEINIKRMFNKDFYIGQPAFFMGDYECQVIHATLPNHYFVIFNEDKIVKVNAKSLTKNIPLTPEERRIKKERRKWKKSKEYQDRVESYRGLERLLISLGIDSYIDAEDPGLIDIDVTDYDDADQIEDYVRKWGLMYSVNLRVNGYSVY